MEYSYSYCVPQFVSSCGVAPLFDLLSSSNKDVKRCATALIASLAEDKKTSAVFCHRGYVIVLLVCIDWSISRNFSLFLSLSLSSYCSFMLYFENLTLSITTTIHLVTRLGCSRCFFLFFLLNINTVLCHCKFFVIVWVHATVISASNLHIQFSVFVHKIGRSLIRT